MAYASVNSPAIVGITHRSIWCAVATSGNHDGGVETIQPQGIGDPTGLLHDQDLLARGVSRAAEFGWLIDRRKSELAGQLLLPRFNVVGDLALVHLGVDFPRDQLLVDELASTLLDLTILGREPVAQMTLFPFSRSLRICWLASLPGAPITQPPGCVPEPHW